MHAVRRELRDSVFEGGYGGSMGARPTTRYARGDSFNVAFQTIGDGPIDLVFVPNWINNIEAAWDEPSFAGFLRSLAAFSRLIWFDKRGTGLSDPITPEAPL